MTSTTAPQIPAWRRLPIGVEVNADGEAHARVWAPRRKSAELVTYEGDAIVGAMPLTSEPCGYFSGPVPGVRAGTRYRFRLDAGDAFPDPASRYQPEGPHGASQVVDASTFRWTDATWRGIELQGQIILEIHIGTFTTDGTFRAAIDKLDALVDVGITTIEIMPLADFPGKFGWGYDGVNMYAPARIYGTPDDLRALVDAAHSRGLGVILDVVYNHLGPDGNYLSLFSDKYGSGKATEWGDAHNFDGEHSASVREFFVENAGYWISEFHLDGLRLDATQSIFDQSDDHVIARVVGRARSAAGNRGIIVIAENERQDRRLLADFGVDAMWNDDFHHAAFVAMTGTNEAYNSGYHGSPQEFISAAKYGYLYQGQYYAWQKDRRGTSTLRFGPARYVNYIDSHDQVANSPNSRRLLEQTTAGRYRAMTALLLLGPQTPMLFQGEEFGATTPFFYFADHGGELGRMVRVGRAEFLSQFPSFAKGGGIDQLPDPAADDTFARCKLDWRERDTHVEALALHRDLIALRKSDPVILRQRGAIDLGLDGAVIGDRAFMLRFFADDGDDRLLVVNFGGRFHADPIAEPLLAPPTQSLWRTKWSSDDPRYGGTGIVDVDVEKQGWWIPGESAVLLAPHPL